MGLLVDAIERAKQVDDPYLENLHAVGEEIGPKPCLSFYELHGVELDHCVLAGADFSKASFYDCVLVGCDLSNAMLEEAYLARTRFVGCKLEGARMGKAFLRSSRFIDCMCRYANMGEMTLESSSLVGCDLREAFLNEVRFRKKTRLQNCDLTRVDFFRTSLKGMDLSTCTIAGIAVSDTHSELKGALISREQAQELVGMLGVRMVD